MAAPMAEDEPASPVFDYHVQQHDPFSEPTPPPVRDTARQRFSNFDPDFFALGPNASPAQARRALEAHLAETDRRMEEAGRLGTALVAQRKELEERLQEVANQQEDSQLSEELKQRLADIEKEYNEVARESARAFLPKPRVPSNEATGGSHTAPDGKGGRRSASPSKFEGHAEPAPTKLGGSNRRSRNQAGPKLHDIELAAEISTSLIAQVRNLQAILSEKEEELRDVRIEKSKLEYDAEGFQQRLKTLDESESRYKDENWSLETQIHELEAAQRDSTAREKKLQQTVNILQSEKTATQRELDEAKVNFARLTDEYAVAVKTHDVELGAAKRNLVMADSERFALQRKIEDLTSQNQELAKAFAAQRGRTMERSDFLDVSPQDYETIDDGGTPEHSPPPVSPMKGTPRHAMLETETLKTSLGHAQRTIQSLRTNVHREKTEKLELRRMLQDARDELEKTRQEPVPATPKQRKNTLTKDFKKPPKLLGNLRSVRSEIYADDENWEDASDAGNTPDHPFSSQRPIQRFDPVSESTETDDFETANEDDDPAFDTAHERGNTTDDFQTGAENFSSSDDDMTETESPSKGTIRGRPAAMLTRNDSLHSTASTEDEYDSDVTQLPSLQQKFPLRASRGGFRRPRRASEVPSVQSSPRSFINTSVTNTPRQPSQSLAAELGDFDTSDNESSFSATPNRSIKSRPGSTRGTIVPAMPQMPFGRALPQMVDSGMMTEPMPRLLPMSAATDRPISMATVTSQAPSEYSEMAGQDLEDKLAKFPSPPASPRKTDYGVPPEEVEILRQEHAKQIEQLHVENAAAHAAAVDALKSSHGYELSRTVDEAKSAHAQELQALKSNHAEEASKSSAEALAAHAKELEVLQANHEAKIADLESELNAAHASELQALKMRHQEQLEAVQKDSDAAHAAELAALVAAHAAQIEHAKKELTDSHVKELDTLKAAHAEQIELAKQDSDAAHAKELEALKAANMSQIDETKSSIAATHARELEALKAAHATQVEQSKKDSESAHTAALAVLAASHAEKLEASKAESDAFLAQHVETLKQTHEEKLRASKVEGEALIAKEIEALKAAHDEQLRSTKAEGESNLAREIEALRVVHMQQLSAAQTESDAKLSRELDTLRSEHSKQLEESKKHSDAAHAAAVAALAASHAKQLDESRKESDGAHAAELAALAASHTQKLEQNKQQSDATLERELQSLRSTHAEVLDKTNKERDAAQEAALAALAAAHAKELSSAKTSAEANLAKELASAKEAHSQEIETIRAEHSAAHAQELEGFKSALAKQVESSKSAGDAAHTQQIEALNAAHAEILDAHKRDSDNALAQALESAKANHERHVQSLQNDHSSSRSKEVEELTSKHDAELAALKTEILAAKDKDIAALIAQHQTEIATLNEESSQATARSLEDMSASHAKEVEALQAEFSATKAKELAELSADHNKQLEALRTESAAAMAKELAELTSSHEKQLGAAKAEAATAKSRELEEATDAHEKQIEKLRAEATAAKLVALEELTASHNRQLETTRAEAAAAKSKELEELSASHARELQALKTEHESAMAKLVEEMAAKQVVKLKTLESERDAAKAMELEELQAAHDKALAALREEHESLRAKELDDLKSGHATLLASLRTEHQTALDDTLANLKASHAQEMESLASTHSSSQTEALAALEATHSEQLEALKTESEAAMARELEAAQEDHSRQLEAQHAQSLADKEKLLASHALELEALRHSLTVTRPTLGYSAMRAVETEPIEPAEPTKLTELTVVEGEHDLRRSPWREGFIIPRDQEEPHTPHVFGVSRRGDQDADAPITAEDETRQSESQQPFGEMSASTDARPFRQTPVLTVDSSSQTALTAEGIDRMLLPSKHQRRSSSDSINIIPAGFADASDPTTLLHAPSQESLGSAARARGDSGIVSAAEPVPTRRPGSSTSMRSAMQTMPPLPANHREAIEAARTGSSGGAKSAMGPPSLPASAMRPGPRPWTPRSDNRPMSPSSPQHPHPPHAHRERGTPTPRALRTTSAQGGYADVQSPTRLPARSRQSSISSFASEIETRFNNIGQTPMDSAGLTGPGTDPRMIQAITQTMIGEHLWKYTRKPGRGEMSENRHRRYFWVHPYTRTLYWSDRDPSTAGRHELRAKSVPIEAVRVVTDDNPMPPGLHRKSLVIISPGRTVKFTCTTGQRHETWFNALSYLLLRTGDEGQADAEEMAGHIAQDDVEEFNGSQSQLGLNGTRPRAPPSLSSYNSRTTRNESPGVDMSIPTLTPTHERGQPRASTLGRLSRYSGGILQSLRSRSRSGIPDDAIYEASEVNDSAEELRQMIEQQDRDSDRLENVRACCDGKHDVGTLSHSSKRNRQSHTHSHSHTHPVQSRTSTPTPLGTLRSRG